MVDRLTEVQDLISNVYLWVIESYIIMLSYSYFFLSFLEART